MAVLLRFVLPLFIGSAVAAPPAITEYPVTNAVGSIMSENFVIPEGFPEIMQQPFSRETFVGDSPVFYVAANGIGPFSYQWYFNGAEIDGATEQLLTVNNVTFASAGTYRVRVSNEVGHVFSDPATLEIRGPEIYGLDPGEVYAGGEAFTLSLHGQGFPEGSTILWNGVSKITVWIDDGQLQADISADEIAPTGDIRLIVLQVQIPTGEISTAAATLPIFSSEVIEYATTVILPGESTGVTMSPYDPGTVGLSVEFENSGVESETAGLITVIYDTNPTSVPLFDVGSQFVDLQIKGADSSDVAVAQFYYSSAITGTAETELGLRYFDGVAWQDVRTSGGAVPTKDMTDNLDDSVSGGRFTVVFDNTSIPAVTQLTGTVFAFTANPQEEPGKKDEQPPKIKSISASPDVIKNANHRMVSVTIAAKVTDNRDAHPTVRIISVKSNEPASGTGDGDLSPDWEITGDLTFNLRAEHGGKANGRVYTITVEARDAAGNTAEKKVKVSVPKPKKNPSKPGKKQHSAGPVAGLLAWLRSTDLAENAAAKLERFWDAVAERRDSSSGTSAGSGAK